MTGPELSDFLAKTAFLTAIGIVKRCSEPVKHLQSCHPPGGPFNRSRDWHTGNRSKALAPRLPYGCENSPQRSSFQSPARHALPEQQGVLSLIPRRNATLHKKLRLVSIECRAIKYTVNLRDVPVAGSRRAKS